MPADKVIARRQRSFDELAWFGPNVDHCWIFDNSTGEPRLTGSFAKGQLLHMGLLPPDLMTVLQARGITDAL